jgi:hypothetical protein
VTKIDNLLVPLSKNFNKNGEKQNQYWLMNSHSKKCVKWKLRLETHEYCQKNRGHRESTLEWLELEL